MALELGLRGHPSGDHFYCRCPLHNDRTASFSLNLRTGLWFCHSEQRGGSFGMLVAEAQGTTIGAAERWIAEQAYVVRPMTLELPAEPENDLRLLRDQYNRATDSELPDYWFKRGFGWEAADHWGIRWNAESQRLVIPHRWDGELVGLITRAIRAGDEPKYRNSANFPRKTTLFGFDSQLEAELILLVEGPFDVFNAWQQGYAALATFGAYATKAQLEQLRLLPKLRMVMVACDNDPEGRKAVPNVRKIVSDRLCAARVFRFPPARKDIGECTAEEIKRGIEQSEPT